MSENETPVEPKGSSGNATTIRTQFPGLYRRRPQTGVPLRKAALRSPNLPQIRFILATSEQVRLPAEFKHIIKRRKRN